MAHRLETRLTKVETRAVKHRPAPINHWIICTSEADAERQFADKVKRGTANAGEAFTPVVLVAAQPAPDVLAAANDRSAIQEAR